MNRRLVHCDWLALFSTSSAPDTSDICSVAT
eukprot:COSAG02_NODE_63017_length_264_cov_0.696970_1_plen_30_part_10